MCIYAIFALFCGYQLYRIEVTQDHIYRIETNRLIERLQAGEKFEPSLLKDYPHIKDITFLSHDTQDEKAVYDFYQMENQQSSYVYPWFKSGKVLGYMKFSYIVKAQNMEMVWLLIEGILLIMELLIIGILLYLRKYFITPFYQLQDLPLQLAKGHYRSDIKVQKDRHMRQFLWGMSQLKDALLISQKRQLEWMKEKKQLLLTLSHDLRTPLNLIKLYSRALEDDLYQNEDDKKHAIQQIGVKTIDLERYVNSIIKSTKEDVLDLEVENGEFYLADLIKRVLAMYQRQCCTRNITLIIERYENRLLKGDIDRSQEVFENLFENAFKYGDGRKITISFAEEEFCLLIRFFSSGGELLELELPHVFDSFFRGSNSEGRSGSGLGLYICREYMRKMDGAIYVEQVDDGVAFTVVFS